MTTTTRTKMMTTSMMISTMTEQEYLAYLAQMSRNSTPISLEEFEANFPSITTSENVEEVVIQMAYMTYLQQLAIERMLQQAQEYYQRQDPLVHNG